MRARSVTRSASAIATCPHWRPSFKVDHLRKHLGRLAVADHVHKRRHKAPNVRHEAAEGERRRAARLAVRVRELDARRDRRGVVQHAPAAGAGRPGPGAGRRPAGVPDFEDVRRAAVGGDIEAKLVRPVADWVVIELLFFM